MATIADLLRGKSSRVFSIAPTASVLDATQLMNQHKIGALVVSAGDEECSRVVGMFTERDVLTRVVAEGRDPRSTLVEEVMSTDVAYCRPDMNIDEVGAVMRQRRIRHLPVCEGGHAGRFCDLISIGDLNAFHADGQAIEIHYLNEYIHGRV